MIYIYGLIDPLTNQISYVGQSNDPFRRWEEHCSGDNTLKGEWVRRLKASGITPVVVILDHVHGGDPFLVENWWIEFGRRMGWPLTNSTPDLSSKYDLSSLPGANVGRRMEPAPWMYLMAESFGITIDEYLTKLDRGEWGFPTDYPLVGDDESTFVDEEIE